MMRRKDGAGATADEEMDPSAANEEQQYKQSLYNS